MVDAQILFPSIKIRIQESHTNFKSVSHIGCGWVVKGKQKNPDKTKMFLVRQKTHTTGLHQWYIVCCTLFEDSDLWSAELKYVFSFSYLTMAKYEISQPNVICLSYLVINKQTNKHTNSYLVDTVCLARLTQISFILSGVLLICINF